MKHVKTVFLPLLALFIITFVVPTLVVLPFSGKEDREQLKEDIVKTIPSEELLDSVEVAVYRTKEEMIEKLPMEKYIVGVVSAEMPANFELEALKAQALAARTYLVNQMMNPDAEVPEGAHVTDTINHQVYKNETELREQWGPDFQENYSKIVKAVLETKGQVLTYKNQPITAAFFSTGNGFTENSGAYWENDFPYLKSVESPWDTESPKFNDQKIVSVSEFEQKLGVSLTNDDSVGTIIEKTPGKRVASVSIGGKTFTGRQIREKLELRSTDFTWYRKNDQIVINTKGYGHGVGMSQYGANGMAEDGSTYQDIVKHYYQGIAIAKSETLLTQKTTQTAQR